MTGFRRPHWYVPTRSYRAGDIDICVTQEEAQALTVQHELNLAVFKATVTLFERLQLEPSDGTTGEDVAHAVSRLFIRYASFLVKTWEIIRYDGNVGAILLVKMLSIHRSFQPRDDGISEKSSFSKVGFLSSSFEAMSDLVDRSAYSNVKARSASY